MSTHAGMKCPEPCCPFFSTNKEDLLDHVNVTHLKFPGFRCPQCIQPFLSKRLVTEHQVAAHLVNPTIFAQTPQATASADTLITAAAAAAAHTTAVVAAAAAAAAASQHAQHDQRRPHKRLSRSSTEEDPESRHSRRDHRRDTDDSSSTSADLFTIDSRSRLVPHPSSVLDVQPRPVTQYTGPVVTTLSHLQQQMDLLPHLHASGAQWRPMLFPPTLTSLSFPQLQQLSPLQLPPPPPSTSMSPPQQIQLPPAALVSPSFSSHYSAPAPTPPSLPVFPPQAATFHLNKQGPNLMSEQPAERLKRASPDDSTSGLTEEEERAKRQRTVAFTATLPWAAPTVSHSPPSLPPSLLHTRSDCLCVL